MRLTERGVVRFSSDVQGRQRLLFRTHMSEQHVHIRMQVKRGLRFRGIVQGQRVHESLCGDALRAQRDLHGGEPKGHVFLSSGIRAQSHGQNSVCPNAGRAVQRKSRMSSRVLVQRRLLSTGVRVRRDLSREREVRRVRVQAAVPQRRRLPERGDLRRAGVQRRLSQRQRLSVRQILHQRQVQR